MTDTKIAELRRNRRLVTTTIQECRSGHCRLAAQLDIQPTG